MSDWKIGDSVFVPGVNHSREYTMTVTKVGRKWITCDYLGMERRFSRETLRLDNGGYGGGARVYRSRDEWLVDHDADLIVPTPDASGMTEEAVEADYRAAWECVAPMYPGVTYEAVKAASIAIWHNASAEGSWVDSSGDAMNALTAALPHLTAAKDAEIERLREALGQISRMTPMPDHKANTTTLVAARSIARAALGDAT